MAILISPSFHNNLQEIINFSRNKKKNPQQNLKPVRQAQPTDSRIGHFAQLQKYVSE